MTKHSRSVNKEVAIVTLFLTGGILIGHLSSNKITDALTNLFPSKQTESEKLIFESNRVPFSFQYPNDYKIAILPSWAVYQFENRVEAINLGTTDASPNAGGPATGYIIVEKTSLSSLSLEDQLKKEYEEETEQMRAGMKKPNFSRPLPIFTKVQLGNSEAIKVTSATSTGSVFSPVAEKYYVDRRGLRYIIGVSTTDEAERAKIEEIIKTFDFKY